MNAIGKVWIPVLHTVIHRQDDGVRFHIWANKDQTNAIMRDLARAMPLSAFAVIKSAPAV